MFEMGKDESTRMVIAKPKTTLFRNHLCVTIQSGNAANVLVEALQDMFMYNL